MYINSSYSATRTTLTNGLILLLVQFSSNPDFQAQTGLLPNTKLFEHNVQDVLHIYPSCDFCYSLSSIPQFFSSEYWLLPSYEEKMKVRLRISINMRKLIRVSTNACRNSSASWKCARCLGRVSSGGEVDSWPSSYLRQNDKN